jgi:hypothetical protein
MPWAVGRLRLDDFKSGRAQDACHLQSRIFIGSLKSVEDRMGPGFPDSIVLALNRHHATPVCASTTRRSMSAISTQYQRVKYDICGTKGYLG